MIRVLLADDHGVLRDGLRSLLQRNQDIEVVADAADGIRAVTGSLELQPDVVVMDISMPGLDGIEATRQIHRINSDIKVVILSMQASPQHVFQALQAGASGYVLKESAGAEVVMAVRAAAAGERFLSPAITDLVINSFIQSSTEKQKQDDESPLKCLSPREVEIFKMVAEGYSSREIGNSLFLSPKTIETYRSRLMHKLKVTDLPALIKLAVKYGVTK